MGYRASVAIGLLAAFSVSLTNRAVAAADPDGARLAALCTPCHNLDGRNRGIAPIVGLEASRLVDMMHAFKSDESSSHIMHAVSLSLSDPEIAALADYWAAQRIEAKRP